MECGTNEITNRLIRRFIPKGTYISNTNKKRIKYIRNGINDYPRRLFNYKLSK